MNQKRSSFDSVKVKHVHLLANIFFLTFSLFFMGVLLFMLCDSIDTYSDHLHVWCGMLVLCTTPYIKSQKFFTLTKKRKTKQQPQLSPRSHLSCCLLAACLLESLLILHHHKKEGETEIMSGEDGEVADVCASCGIAEIDEIKLKTCTACKSLRYCSVECQKKHWPDRKSVV